MITDVNQEAARDAAARFGIPRVAASTAEIFADPAIDAVLICSSTDTHADLVVQAAAGRQAHLLREAAGPHAGADRLGAGGGGARGREAAGGLQPPLRCQFRARAAGRDARARSARRT